MSHKDVEGNAVHSYDARSVKSDLPWTDAQTELKQIRSDAIQNANDTIILGIHAA